MKTMKNVLLLVLVTCYAYHNAYTQDLSGQQTWELTTDSNNDGWVDEGDIITCQVNITYNHLTSQAVTLKNGFIDPRLTLLGGSVRTSSGIISSGSDPLDNTLSIDDIYLEAPWGYATISFDVVAHLDAEHTTPLSNKTHIINADQLVETNEILIPTKPVAIVQNHKDNLISNTLALMALLMAGIALGVISEWVKIPSLTFKSKV